MSHVDPPLRLLSLCSGLGAADLACSRLGVRLVGAVERQAYAAACILARMEEEALDPAPVWVGDIHDMDARPLRGWVDVVAAGIPCVSWSRAGKQRGADDERHLGDELLRIVREVEPRFVLVENVPGFAVPDGLGALLGELAELGFDAEWDWVVAAHADRARRDEAPGPAAPGRGELGAHAAAPHAPRNGRHEGGAKPAREQGGPDSAERGDDAPDADRPGRPQERERELLDRQRAPRRDDADGRDWSHWHGGPPSSPVVRGVDDGSPASLVIAERLHALGNAWVPAQAEAALRELFGRFG